MDVFSSFRAGCSNWYSIFCCSSLKGNRQIKARVVRSKSCSLTRSSAAALLLGSRVRVPLRAWMFVSCVECCVGSCPFDELIAGLEKSYRVCGRVIVCI